MEIIIARISKITSILLIVLSFVGCKPDNSKESEIITIPVSINIERFDQKFHRSNPEMIFFTYCLEPPFITHHLGLSKICKSP